MTVFLCIKIHDQEKLAHKGVPIVYFMLSVIQSLIINVWPRAAASTQLKFIHSMSHLKDSNLQAAMGCLTTWYIL